MSTAKLTPAEVAASTLEILWQQDASAFVFSRSADGEVSASGLAVGKPAIADLAHVGEAVEARRVEVVELIRLAETRAPGLEPGGSAEAVFAVVELGRRSLAEGLVHPTLTYDGGDW